VLFLNTQFCQSQICFKAIIPGWRRTNNAKELVFAQAQTSFLAIFLSNFCAFFKHTILPEPNLFQGHHPWLAQNKQRQRTCFRPGTNNFFGDFSPTFSAGVSHFPDLFTR